MDTKRNKGVTTIEYGVMLALIALAVALAAPNISSAVVNLFGKTSNVMARS
jgi:Flp pilus assembly pilin Flp